MNGYVWLCVPAHRCSVKPASVSRSWLSEHPSAPTTDWHTPSQESYVQFRGPTLRGSTTCSQHAAGTVPSPTHSHRITRMGLVGQGTPSHPRPRSIPTPPMVLFSFFLSFFYSPSFSLYFLFCFSSPRWKLQTWGLWAEPQGGKFLEGRYRSGL